MSEFSECLSYFIKEGKTDKLFWRNAPACRAASLLAS